MSSLNPPVAREKAKLLILTAICVAYAAAFTTTLNRQSFIRGKSDFFVRWYPTDKLLREGRNLYDPRNNAEMEQIVEGESDRYVEPGFFGFYYPAYLILLVGPLAKLPYPTAHFLWTFFGQLFLVGALLIAIRLFRWPETVNGQTVLVLAVLWSVPEIQHTIWGQFNTIGVLTLAVVLLLLHRDRYWQAGLVASALLFKPHAYLLAIAYFLLWAAARRRRWPFLFAFGGASFLFWLIPELIQPGWVADFIAAVGRYPSSTRSVVDTLWNPNQTTAIGLTVAATAILALNARKEVTQEAFIGALGLSLAVWAFMVPILGMFHILVLPIVFIPLARIYLRRNRHHFRWLMLSLTTLYVAGWIGFLIGIIGPGLYGFHIGWSELAYKVGLPLVLVLFSLPLCWPAKPTNGTSA